MEELHSTAGWLYWHTCDENENQPCLACCGTVEAYQEACGVPEELRGVLPPKPYTEEDAARDAARLEARFKARFGGDRPPAQKTRLNLQSQ
jgi:hypothetical protein